MPSNKELQEDIAARAQALGVTVDTAGMNNATLAATLKGLNETQTPAPAAGADADAQAAGADAQAAADAEPARSGYFVAKGTSITSARGIITGEVRDDDLSAEARDALVAAGLIEKR